MEIVLQEEKMDQKMVDVAEIENYLPTLFAEIRDFKDGKLITIDEIAKLKSTANKLLIHFLTKKAAITNNFYLHIDELDANLDIVKACIHRLSS